MSKSELFYEEESKTARPHKYSINYKDKNDSVYAIKFYSMQKQIDGKDKEIEQLNNIINELEKYIYDNYFYDDVGMKIFDVSLLEDKLKELKESGNNE